MTQTMCQPVNPAATNTGKLLHQEKNQNGEKTLERRNTVDFYVI